MVIPSKKWAGIFVGDVSMQQDMCLNFSTCKQKRLSANMFLLLVMCLALNKLF